MLSRCLAHFAGHPVVASAYGVAVAVAVDASAVAAPFFAAGAVAVFAGAVAVVVVAVAVSRISDMLGLHPTQDDVFGRMFPSGEFAARSARFVFGIIQFFSPAAFRLRPPSTMFLSFASLAGPSAGGHETGSSLQGRVPYFSRSIM